MGAHLSKFGCGTNEEHAMEDVEEEKHREKESPAFPSLSAVYPNSGIDFMHLTVPPLSPKAQMPIKICTSVTAPIEESKSSDTLRGAARQTQLSPLTCQLPANDLSDAGDHSSSDTQSVLSIISPTKERKVAPMNLRIPILRPAGLLHRQHTTTLTTSIYAQHEKVGDIEKFFDAPMFEAKQVLFKAILDGDLEAVQRAVEQQLPPVVVARMTWPEHYHDTVLHLAVRSGCLEIVNYFLRRMGGALNARNADGESALSLAGNLRQYEILAHLMRWVVDTARQQHHLTDPKDQGGDLISPYSPYASSSLQPHRRRERGDGEDADADEGEEIMSVLSAMMIMSMSNDQDEGEHKDEHIFDEDEVMQWLTNLERSGHVDFLVGSETEGDDLQSRASTLSSSKLTVTDTALYAVDGVQSNKKKQLGRRLLPKGMRKAAGRALRQFSRFMALPQSNRAEVR